MTQINIPTKQNQTHRNGVRFVVAKGEGWWEREGLGV